MTLMAPCAAVVILVMISMMKNLFVKFQLPFKNKPTRIQKEVRIGEWRQFIGKQQKSILVMTSRMGYHVQQFAIEPVCFQQIFNRKVHPVTPVMLGNGRNIDSFVIHLFTT